jgi:predicted nucleic acid-binding protein
LSAATKTATRSDLWGFQHVDEIFSIDLGAIERAEAIVLGNRRLSARDALHLAVMEREGVHRIMSFDRGFDGVPGVERLS